MKGVAFYLALLFVACTGLYASGIQDGFVSFGDQWFSYQEKVGAEKPWPTIKVLAKWGGSKRELLGHLSDPGWVARSLRGGERGNVKGRRTGEGGVFSVAFPVVGSLDIPVEQSVEMTKKGFRVTFRCEKLWAASFEGAIEVEELPPSKIKVPYKIQPEQFLVLLTIKAEPKFPLAATISEDYQYSVVNQFVSLLDSHMREFGEKHYGYGEVAAK